ncbi:U-box domain-containing protein 14 [Typha angustifolia]|uniref:U-box domain-containing protein 14 n=1 Tax=Typha angustifolia TaxID=59011 RepID=UPI003C2B29F4
METDSPRSFGYSDTSSAFSDCNSDRSGEFSPSSIAAAAGSGGAALQRLLLSCAAAESSDEVIRTLVSELESLSSPVESLRRAALELRLLAKHNPENRLRIVAAGAVRPLIDLLSHADPVLQEHGVTALLNLSLCDENKSIIAASGAIRPVVRCLKTGTAAARENAACTLVRLAQLDGLAASIGRAGAIPLLVSLLESGTPRGKKDASTALYALCAGSSRDNKIRAVEAGVVRPLLDLMADPDSGMVDKAAFVLNAVIVTAEGRVAAVDEGGIPVLVEMVEVGSPRQKEIATLCLLQICEDSSVNRLMVVREGAIPPLVALSQSSAAKPKLRTKAEALIEMLRQPRSGSVRAGGGSQ